MDGWKGSDCFLVVCKCVVNVMAPGKEISRDKFFKIKVFAREGDSVRRALFPPGFCRAHTFHHQPSSGETS